MATDVVRRLTFSAALNEDRERALAELEDDNISFDNLDTDGLLKTIEALQSQLAELEGSLVDAEAQTAEQATLDAALWYKDPDNITNV